MPDALVTIARFRDLPEALLAQGKLQSAGIACFLADSELVRADWLWSNAIGNMRLQVAPEDAPSALDLLHEPPPESFTEDEVGEVYQQPHCPNCDSLDIGYGAIDRIFGYGLMYFGLPIPVTRKNWKCHACGAEWVEEPDAAPADGD
jgi:hypothetical protein